MDKRTLWSRLEETKKSEERIRENLRETIFSLRTKTVLVLHANPDKHLPSETKFVAIGELDIVNGQVRISNLMGEQTIIPYTDIDLIAEV